MSVHPLVAPSCSRLRHHVVGCAIMYFGSRHQVASISKRLRHPCPGHVIHDEAGSLVTKSRQSRCLLHVCRLVGDDILPFDHPDRESFLRRFWGKSCVQHNNISTPRFLSPAGESKPTVRLSIRPSICLSLSVYPPNG